MQLKWNFWKIKGNEERRHAGICRHTCQGECGPVTPFHQCPTYHKIGSSSILHPSPYQWRLFGRHSAGAWNSEWTRVPTWCLTWFFSVEETLQVRYNSMWELPAIFELAKGSWLNAPVAMKWDRKKLYYNQKWHTPIILGHNVGTDRIRLKFQQKPTCAKGWNCYLYWIAIAIWFIDII